MSLHNLIKSIDKGEILLPRLKQYLLGRYEQEHNGKLSRKDGVIADAKMTIACFKDRMETYDHGAKRPDNYFHPSQLGACMRALWYGHKGAPANEGTTGDTVLRDYFTFEFGTYFGVLFQNLCEMAGVLKSRETLVLSHKYQIEGHADGELAIDKREYLLEIKTINDRRFTRLGGMPEESHKKQVHAYMKVRNLKWCIIIYYNKERAQLKEFVIPFEDDYFKENVLKRIAYYKKVMPLNVPPTREGTNPRIFPCSFCNFSRVCFDSNEEAKFLRKLRNEGITKQKVETKKCASRCKLRIKARN